MRNQANTQIEDLEREVSDLKETIGEKDDQIRGLEDELGTAEETIRELEN